MTEEKAKTKSCCGPPAVYAAVVALVAVQASKDSNPLNVTVKAKCIGSDCMAWRYAGANRDTGYCGLAGADRA